MPGDAPEFRAAIWLRDAESDLALASVKKTPKIRYEHLCFSCATDNREGAQGDSAGARRNPSPDSRLGFYRRFVAKGRHPAALTVDAARSDEVCGSAPLSRTRHAS